ncbi:outer membrane protein OmpX [Pantoea sp. Aalb]|uniref:outer membrane protein OmpX n=1 Tax=Pantoea sp. Aalb TaxID=2576762 RepID=UPI00132229AA|nr:outer membrane protein OmpX [Pantoea sp. Aalb]MXP67509.1 outer membrane protein OmpX [Pantoea sp. Aalb]
MKKIIFLSVLTYLLSIHTCPAVVIKSTVSTGYAQGDIKGFFNKNNGFTLKYREENEANPLGWITSFNYIERDLVTNGVYRKSQFYSFTGGPAYRLNDNTYVYGTLGLGYGKFNSNMSHRRKKDISDVGFTYGIGFQFHLFDNFSLDIGYEMSRIRNLDVGTWVAGIAYTF